ncbi:putative quinol monooxygenase [Azospirillum brasilense]|uniref:putative quinol monooxygenase n=1 Tax=Azospirillum brasilense TaxID=192 RepID=UPI003D7C7C63
MRLRPSTGGAARGGTSTRWEDDPNLWFVCENWISQADFNAHMRMPYVQDFMADVRDLCTRGVTMPTEHRLTSDTGPRWPSFGWLCHGRGWQPCLVRHPRHTTCAKNTVHSGDCACNPYQPTRPTGFSSPARSF